MFSINMSAVQLIPQDGAQHPDLVLWSSAAFLDAVRLKNEEFRVFRGCWIVEYVN